MPTIASGITIGPGITTTTGVVQDEIAQNYNVLKGRYGL